MPEKPHGPADLTVGQLQSIHDQSNGEAKLVRVDPVTKARLHKGYVEADSFLDKVPFAKAGTFGIFPASVGLCVIDVDLKDCQKHGAGLEECSQAAIDCVGSDPLSRALTMGGGEHLFYRAPDHPVKNAPWKFGDLRGPTLGGKFGDGGYVVVYDVQSVLYAMSQASDAAVPNILALPKKKQDSQHGGWTPEALAVMGSGDRNNYLNTGVLKAAQRPGYGGAVRQQWRNAALASGLPADEVDGTIASAEAGAAATLAAKPQGDDEPDDEDDRIDRWLFEKHNDEWDSGRVSRRLRQRGLTPARARVLAEEFLSGGGMDAAPELVSGEDWLADDDGLDTDDPELAPGAPGLFYNARIVAAHGQAGAGKSTYAAWAAAEMTRAGLRVLAAVDDDVKSWQVNLRRFDAVRENVSRITFADATKTGALEKAAETHDAIVIDSWRLWAGSSGCEDLNSESCVSPVIDRLSLLAHSGKAVLLLANEAKNADVASVRGSGAVNDAVDAVRQVTRDSMGTTTISQVESRPKTRIGIPVGPWLARLEDDSFTIGAIPTGQGGSFHERIAAHLAADGGWVAKGVLGKAVGGKSGQGKWKQFSEALETLINNGTVETEKQGASLVFRLSAEHSE